VTLDAKWAAEIWAEELKAVLQFLTAEDWTTTVSSPSSGSAPVGYFWWTQQFDITPGAEISIGAPALAWSELGARVLQSAGVELIEQASAKSTYLEAVQQSMSGMARALSEKSSRTVEATSGREESPVEGGAIFEVVVHTGGLDLPALRIVVNAALSNAFEVQAKSSPQPSSTSEGQGQQKAARAEGIPLPPTSVSVLLDVQMPVSICFGRASMPLREIMKLTSGSAVELDRRPDDEVDIIVNNCVIARGEVVVIDGNYGVRVTAIISREQRLALRPGTR
jgi:flagellar motor switch protein FliN